MRFELAGLVGTSEDPRVADALRRRATHPEVVAAAFPYFLRTPDVVDDQTLIEAFHRYGGASMTKAFRESGRAPLVKAAEEEERAPRYKGIEVQ